MYIKVIKMGDNIHHFTSYKQNIHYLTSYKQFFSRFSSSVDPSDQLPVKVAGYNLSEFELVGAITDWCLQYLNQRCVFEHISTFVRIICVNS